MTNLYVLDLETSTDKDRAANLSRNELIFESELTFTCAMMYAPVSLTKPKVNEFYGKSTAEKAILDLPSGIFYTWNGAKFDLHFIYHLLRKASYYIQETTNSKQSKKKQLKLGEMSYLLVGSRILNLKFRNSNGVVELRDACLLFTTSLEKFIKDAAPEFPKLVGTYDYDKMRYFEKDFSETDKEYCRSDIYGFSVGLARIQKDFEREFDMDILSSLTAGSFAMKYARRELTNRREKDIENNILFSNTNDYFPELDDLFPTVTFDRKFIGGGRTYANPKHEGKIMKDLTKIDAKSFYPSLMVQSKLPWGKTKRIKMNWLKLKEYLSNNPDKYVFAHLHSGRIKYDDMFSPICVNVKGIREYPTHATAEDGVYLDDNILRDPKFLPTDSCIFDCYIYNSATGILDYLSKLFDLKNHYKFSELFALELAVKIILNSTFGKFIQRDNVKEYDFMDGIIEPTGRETTLSAWHLYAPMGAAITANGRYVLTGYMNLLQERFIYCDTDSLIFYGAVPKEIDLGTKLGQWEVEASPTGFMNNKGKIVNKTIEGIFFQRKTYAINIDGVTKITFCGISSKAVEKRFPKEKDPKKHDDNIKIYPNGIPIAELQIEMEKGIIFNVLQGNKTLSGVALIERAREKKYSVRL